MASQVAAYKCPACMGPLHLGTESGMLECDYCGSKFEVAEIEAGMKEQNEEAAAAMEEGGQDQWASQSWGAEAEGMKSYGCPSCGAQLVCDANTAATCCPYCGNQTVIPGQFSGKLKPEYVIPFKKDREAAIETLKAHYKGKFLLPKSFVEGNHIEDIQGVYVPFWMFDCTASGDMQFDATTSTKKTEGNREITTTKHYDVRRSGSILFEKVPVDASSRMPDGHMDSIEPYDYSQLKDFSMAYMPGFLAEKYDVEEQDCLDRMKERCAKTFESEVTKTVTGYDTESVRSKNIHVRKTGTHYAMLPVWLLATKWNDQNFLFAMNGQSGKMVGDLPMDKKKFCLSFFGIWAVATVLALAGNFLFMDVPATGLKMILICVGVPLLMALLVCLALASQLKSVRSQLAASYIGAQGLKLTRKEDIYVRSTTSTRTLKSGNE